MDILDKIKQDENRKLEFKEKFPKGKQLLKTAIAFANGAGGDIIIGIEDRTKRIIGLTENEMLGYPDRIASSIFDGTFPAVIPEISSAVIEGRNILIITIQPLSMKPCYLKSVGKDKGTYVRVGATNKQATQEVLQELHRQSMNLSFDEEVYRHIVNPQSHIETIRKDFEHYTDRKLIRSQLLTLKLIDEHQGEIFPTAGLLLLTGHPMFDETARIKCARFKGTSMSEFIDRKEYTGVLTQQVEQAIMFVKNHLPVGGKIKDIQRNDIYEIPIPIIRELIINAVVHRDYSLSGADIKLAIFDDRVEIASPGVLPKSLEMKNILSGRSEIRNRVIARFFKEIGFIEQWGTGVPKIIHLCKTHRLQPPLWQENGQYLKAIIYRETVDKLSINDDKTSKTVDILSINDDKASKTVDIPSINDDKASETVDILSINDDKTSETVDILSINDDTVSKTVDIPSINDDKTSKTVDNEQILLNYINQHERLTNKQAQTITGLSPTGVRYLLQKLIAQGRIKSQGKNKGRFYIKID